MRGNRAAKVDANQGELVDVMRRMGASVVITSVAGDGFPDTVVGWGGISVLAEIKDGAKVPSKRKLTEDQKKFHEEHKGAVTVIETVEQAVSLVNRIREVASKIGSIDWYMGAIANSPGEG